MNEKRDTLQNARNYAAERRRKQRWLRAVTVMAAVVVFCTTYALILPAITLEKKCEIPEHTHTDACYTQVTSREVKAPACPLEIHTHTEECLDAENHLSCGYADFVVHQHDAACYDEGGNLWCTLLEIEAHQHEDACYAVPEAHVHGEGCYARERGELICTESTEPLHRHSEECYTESREISCEEEHEHTEECYTVQQELICELTEEPAHTHGDGCYEWTQVLTCGLSTEPGEPVLVCGKEEVILHTHEPYEDEENPGCCDADGNLICGMTEVLEHQHTDACYETVTEPVDTQTLTCTLPEDENHTHGPLCYGTWELSCTMEEHTHSEACMDEETEPSEEETQPTEEETKPVYICGLEEHTHDASCMDESLTRICGLPEHTHTDACTVTESEYLCDQEVHTHEEACLDTAGTLICGMEEHVHTDACKVKTLTCEGADYAVTVRYGTDAGLPKDVTLSVREIPADSEEYRGYLDQAKAAIEDSQDAQTVLFARFFDVQFQLNGEKVEPAAAVDVTITYAEPVETAEDANCQAIHFAEAGTEILDVTTEQKEDGSTSFTHTQSGFSVTGYVVTVSAPANPADVGPNRLPVDYYVCIDGTWTCVGSTKMGCYFQGNGDLTDYNRDYITVAQAVSILKPYGFSGNEANPSRVTAYQQKSGNNTNVYCDTDTVTCQEGDANGKKIMPLSRNGDHAGYNLYYLPNNNAQIDGVASPENLEKAANGFYTVKVFGAQGNQLASQIVKTGGSFTYNATDSGVTSWLVAYGSGSTTTISGSNINLSNITSPVTISPNPGGDVGSHSVTFKVMIDGQWKTVGSLPYYYSGDVNGSQRAYITSAMAAQMFGDYGYTAETEPGYHFGYSYNDLYNIIYCDADSKAPTNFCMDVAGGQYVQGTAIQVYTPNGSDAQLFRIRDAEAEGHEGYSYITPFKNSSLQVNLSGSGEGNGQKIVLWASPTIHSSWKVIPGDNGTVSFQLKENQEFYMDVSGNKPSIQPPTQLQIWNNAGARYWKLVQQYRISNDTASEQNTDGTWNIGLTPESNGDIVCYYMPAETENAYTNAAESAISTDNSFWSVSVRDDTHSVYSEGELSAKVQIVKPGAEAIVTVRNANGILWSCRGVNGQPVEVKSTQSGGETTFTITSITQPVEIVATKANPSFTVQYYANIPRFATSGENPLKVIDTSGKALPTNGGNMATKNLYLEEIGRNTTQNAGVATMLYRVATTIELTKMYTEKECQYASEPGLEYFNKLKDNEDYVLMEIWVLKDGKPADSTNRDDWDVYPYDQEKTAFTNEAGQAVDGTILICDGAVIRLVFDSSSGDYHNGTTFYDYNISSGQHSDGRWRTGITGINIEANYGTSPNGQRNWNSTSDILAFGNANCGTGMSGYLFDGSTLNKYSQLNKSYGGATFSLVAGLKSDGTLRYNDWIVAPKLFNEGDAQYKQTYTGSSLAFDRVGDTYTLSAASLSGGGTIGELQYFFHPSPSGNCIWDGENNQLSSWQNNIFTNNFWPMDSASGRTDGLWGKFGSPGSFQGFTESNSHSYGDLPADFPESDDGRAHNWFFGMNFALSFNLTADYEGPLEYYFFGDDDLWVFLDNQLVCDIGGVHSSIGEYVNLRDYLPVGQSGQHTLSFFYTERGASGSTCWMSFTLPSVSSATTSRDTGSLQIAKSLEETGDADFSGEEYQFKVELLTSENGSGLNQTFSYSRSDGTYGTVKSGGTIALHKDENVTISGIPAGTFYRVTELTTQGYHTTVNDNEGYIVSGNIANGETKPAFFVNRPYTELPSTGGAGTTLYSTAGLTLIFGAALLLYRHFRRRKEDVVSS